MEENLNINLVMVTKKEGLELFSSNLLEQLKEDLDEFEESIQLMLENQKKVQECLNKQEEGALSVGDLVQIMDCRIEDVLIIQMLIGRDVELLQRELIIRMMNRALEGDC